MKATQNYITEAKEKLGFKADNKLCIYLDITPGSISNYKNGRRIIDDYAAMKIAEILNIEPLEVIAAANAERENKEKKREFWIETWKKYKDRN